MLYIATSSSSSIGGNHHQQQQHQYDQQQFIAAAEPQISLPVNYPAAAQVVVENEIVRDGGQVSKFEAVKLNDGSTLYRTTYQSVPLPLYETTQYQIEDDRQPSAFPIDVIHHDA